MSDTTKQIIRNYLETDKISAYIKSLQYADGTYPGMKPDVYSSYKCALILLALGKKPQFQTTYTWAESLQTGRRGFAETTGQNSWDYTTFYGSKLHNLLKIKPRHPDDLRQFILSHLNSDGGFGGIPGASSTIQASINFSESLLDLEFKDAISNSTLDYFEKLLHDYTQIDAFTLYGAARLLQTFDREIKNIDSFYSYCNNLILSNDLPAAHYGTLILQLLHQELPNQDAIQKFLNIDNPNLTDKSMIVPLLKLYEIDFDEKEYLGYVYSLELPAGGFYDDSERSPLTAYESVQSLRIMDDKVLKPQEMTKWIESTYLQLPNNYHLNALHWALRSVDLAKSNINKELWKEFIESRCEFITPWSFLYLSTMCLLFDYVPKNHRRIVKEIMSFQNSDGGFTPVHGGTSNMYDTFRAVVSLYNLHTLLAKQNVIHLNFLTRIKTNVVRWLTNCENEEGGYGWIPGEISYMQPTYTALHASYVLSHKPNHLEKHIEYIKKNQNKDGGFHGGENDTPSWSLYTYYALASLLLLDSFKNNSSLDLDYYLGL